jgi:hypothetical protein
MKTYPSKTAVLGVLPLLILLPSVASLTAQQPSDPGKDRIPGGRNGPRNLHSLTNIFWRSCPNGCARILRFARKRAVY